MEDHLNDIELKKSLYQKGLEHAKEQMVTVESIHENQIRILTAIDAGSDPENWVTASKQLIVWTEELTEAIGEVTKYQALIQMLDKVGTTVRSLVNPDPME